MTLTKKQKKDLTEKVRYRFRIPRIKAYAMVCDFENLLQYDDQKFLYELHYEIFLRQDPEFTYKVFRSLVSNFLYLSEQTKKQEDKEVLFRHFNKIFELLFIQRCTHAKKVEEKAATAQHILMHISQKLNGILDTQELMIANISHEMRTSLNAIYGYLSIIDGNDRLYGEEKYYLQKANHATLTLQSLVKDILNVTKINSGQLEIQKEYFWLDVMLLKCIDTLALEIKKKKRVKLKTEIDFFPSQVYGDQTHIMEIIINLLSNAFKYTEKGYVKLKMKCQPLKKGVHITFAIEDSGIGMTETQMKDIFAPYSRFKTEKQGLGLGLHITKQLSEKLNGTLKVKSTIGKGSTFSFSLLFDDIKQGKIAIQNRKICFFLSDRCQVTMKKKLLFLKEHGAKLDIFDNEAAFLNYLLSLKKDPPDIVFIATHNSEYSKFDALIYYLKTTKLFAYTKFIAENIDKEAPLKYFDEVYEYFSPLKIYESIEESATMHKADRSKEFSILVIDDTETNLDLFKLFVSKKYPNAVIDLANGGYEGIGMFKIKSYDVVFLDLKMPGLDGFSVFKKLKKFTPLPPIYAFSADVYKSNFEKVGEAGFDGLIEKPLQPEKLYKILQKVIDAKNNR